MRILSFADTRFPIERANGVQTMATCLALARRGHDVRLIVRPDVCVPPRDPFAFYGWPPCDRLRIETIAASSSVRTRRAHFIARATARASIANADVIYTRDLGLASVLLRLPLPGRAPVVYESHGVTALVSAELPALLGKPELASDSDRTARLDRRERRVWQRAQACIAITRALADELTARHGARERVFVVPDGARLDRESAPAREADGAGTPRALAAYAGHLYPWKGVDVFVEALARAPHVRGLIVGGHPREDDLARVQALVDRLGMADRVTITGLVAPPDVRDHLRKATMLVLPNTPSATSERFTSPLKLFEYLAMGRAIVASDVPAIREVLTDGRTALLVPPGDPVALGAAIERLAADSSLARTLGAASHALAPEYTWDRRAARLDEAFEAARAR